jgi:molecular chaperone GrpE
MSDEEKQTDENATPQEWELNEADEAIKFPDVAGPDEDGEASAEAADPLTAMRAERDALEDKLRRTMADYQNFARRAEQNVVAARQQQLLEVAKQLVTVLDHFDHALGVDAEKASAQDLLKGVNIVRDELMRALSSFGVQRLDVQAGEVFDPNRHEALMRQADTGVEPNHVTSQLQPGYLLNDVTIRPAKVSIAE